MKKNKDDIIATLAANIPAALIKNSCEVDAKSAGPSNDKIVSDSEEDFEYARSHIKKLIDTSDEAIATLHNLATDAEHPRAFEVLSNLIKTAADMNSQLLGLTRHRKKIVQDPVAPEHASVASTNVTNNSIFVGTTSDLQRFLKDREQSDPIDI